MEDQRRKLSLNAPALLPLTEQQSPSTSSSASSSSSASRQQLPPAPPPSLQRHFSLNEAERTYIFTPSDLPSCESSRASSGHSRSISHGGGAMTGGGAAPLRPSLKSALKGGHQRALSQGQISQDAAPRSGHSRVGSKTDFILPPTHKDPDAQREPTSATVLTGSGRGHVRQASRSESIYTLRRQDLPAWWKRFLFFKSSKFEEHGFRHIMPNHLVPPKTPKRDHPNGRYTENKIRTTKYTLLSFLPKNLIEQFHRVANLYFIFIQFLNWVPELNVFGKEIAMFPLLFVLGVTSIKDLFEDRRRFASDKRINNSTCRVYHG